MIKEKNNKAFCLQKLSNKFLFDLFFNISEIKTKKRRNSKDVELHLSKNGQERYLL